MRIGAYYDEFFNGNYLRDFRFLGKTKKVCHAPKWQTTNLKQNRYAKNWLLKQRNTKIANYTKLYGGLSFYSSIIHYQLANLDKKLFNHLFFDFDVHNNEFDVIKHKQNDALENLTGRTLFKAMDSLQAEIQELIFNEDLLLDSWNESRLVHDYFQEQGLRCYCCLSGSKGVHLRVFFNPIHVRNYDRIVGDLTRTLVQEFHLKTIDTNVSEYSPSKSVERLPYTINEKSGLSVVPFDFDTDSLDDALARASRPKIEEFALADYVNAGFGDELLALDEHVNVIVAKEVKAKEKLQQEQKLSGAINGAYAGNGGLFSDLRKLIQFICGDENLVSEHEHYDKWKCVFHDDKNASAIVSKKKYQCLSNNCRIGKINYFEFIREWFNLGTDAEVKEKMVELQDLVDKQNHDNAAGEVVAR